MNTLLHPLDLPRQLVAATYSPKVRCARGVACAVLGLAGGLWGGANSMAAEVHGSASAPVDAHASAKKPAPAASEPQQRPMVGDIKAALREQMLGKKNLTLVVRDKSDTQAESEALPAAEPAAAHAPAVAVPAARSAHASTVAAHAAPLRVPMVRPVPVVNPRASRDYIKAKAAVLTGHEESLVAAAPESHVAPAHGGEPHWAYEGENGPQNWGKLKPEFNVCAIGKRQSPINIEESMTLQGPAEPLVFNYTASTGSVVNNGHTIQVDVVGDNTLTVRGSVYKLVQFHFHTPSEEQVNYRNFAMVAHLVHKNNEGQLAVVAVLLDPGVANALIDKVWTYMPLDLNDRVRMPTGLLDLNEIMPKDQRYYQFIGSLTTPPCTEGVLWMVMKQPSLLSPAQIHLFQQLFPNNARPVQPLNGRPVRDAK